MDLPIASPNLTGTAFPICLCCDEIFPQNSHSSGND